MRPRSLAVLLLSLVVLGGPAWADPDPPEEPLPPIEDYEPTFTEDPGFLHAGATPLGNVDARDGVYLGWDDTAPDAPAPSVYVGNNYAGIAFGDHDPEHFLTMEGTAVGDLDNIAFDLYFSGWAQTTIGCPLGFSIELVIDDEVIVSQDFTGSDGFNQEPVDDTTFRTRFVLTNLWEATELYDLPYGPDVEHNVYLNVQNFYACNEVVWKYDSADYPAGLVVNMPKPTASYFKFDVLNPPPPPG